MWAEKSRFKFSKKRERERERENRLRRNLEAGNMEKGDIVRVLPSLKKQTKSKKRIRKG